MIGSYLESSCIQTVFNSKHVIDHKLLEDVREDSLQIPNQINWFLCNRLDEALKASEHPAVSSRLR
jgi:type II secretory pathway predicted ATPase ExeA